MTTAIDLNSITVSEAEPQPREGYVLPEDLTIDGQGNLSDVRSRVQPRKHNVANIVGVIASQDEHFIYPDVPAVWAIRKGDKLVLVDGRQRRNAAKKYNAIATSKGEKRIALRCEVRDYDETTAVLQKTRANTCGLDMSTVAKAQSAAQLHSQGHPKPFIAQTLGLSEKAGERMVNNYLYFWRYATPDLVKACDAQPGDNPEPLVGFAKGLSCIKVARKLLASQLGLKPADVPESVAAMTPEQKKIYVSALAAKVSEATAPVQKNPNKRKALNIRYARILGQAVAGFGTYGENPEIQQLVKLSGVQQQFGHALLYSIGELTINPKDDGSPDAAPTLPFLRGDQAKHAAFIKLCETLALALETPEAKED